MRKPYQPWMWRFDISVAGVSVVSEVEVELTVSTDLVGLGAMDKGVVRGTLVVPGIAVTNDLIPDPVE